MDPKLMLSTFVAVFIAETGDKTQLATLGFASSATSRMSVFLGAALALVCTTALAVLLGSAISRVIPPIWLKRAAGVVFIVLGVMYLAAKDDARAGTAAPSAGEHSG